MDTSPTKDVYSGSDCGKSEERLRGVNQGIEWFASHFTYLGTEWSWDDLEEFLEKMGVHVQVPLKLGLIRIDVGGSEQL